MDQYQKNVLEALNHKGVIRAWTIQRPSWWRTLQRRGEVRADGRRVCRNFAPSYRWMMEQMHLRIPEYRGGFPIWFWFSPKPDLRDSGILPRGVQAHRIELELPRARILLSDFGSWHCVLNRWHLPISWRESRDWDRKTKGYEPFVTALPDQFEAELRATWTRVFDLHTLNRCKLWRPVTRIQGVVDRVLLSEVRSVQAFVAR